MFQLRHKRTVRDRESGLVFQWRLPLASHFSFIAALVVVSLITAALAATVKIRVGNVSRQPERRGTLLLVPHGREWRSLEMLAMEAGPMPRRADPLADEVVAGILRAHLAGAKPPGYDYVPEFRPVIVDIPPATVTGEPAAIPAVLPPLPATAPPPRDAPLADPTVPLVLADGAMTATAPDGPPPDSLARGSIYLLGYDPAGRVSRVTALAAATPAVDDAAEQWLRGIVIRGGHPQGGWVSITITGGK